MAIPRQHIEGRDDTVSIAVRLPRGLHDALRRRTGSARGSRSMDTEIVAILSGEHPPVNQDDSSLRSGTDLETLAAEQGVAPVADPRTLAGDFWPPEESTDEMLQTIRQWRDESIRRREP